MKNKLSWGIALLPFVPSVWMQGQEQKQGIGNRRPNIITVAIPFPVPVVQPY